MTSCTNNTDAASKRVDMRKAQLRVQQAQKVHECDRLGCSTLRWQQEGLNVTIGGIGCNGLNMVQIWREWKWEAGGMMFW